MLKATLSISRKRIPSGDVIAIIEEEDLAPLLFFIPLSCMMLVASGAAYWQILILTRRCRTDRLLDCKPRVYTEI